MSVRKLGGRLATAAGLTTLVLVGVAATPAAACACGAYVTNSDTSVDRERAAIMWDGTTQDLVISLDVLGASPDAALLMPLPSQAELTLEDPALFDELEDRTHPLVEKVTNWWPNFTFLERLGVGGAGRDTAGEAPVEVLEQGELGPLTVAQLAANDPAALSSWLTVNGYQVDPAVTAATAPYADAGWVIVAMKLLPRPSPSLLASILPP